MVVKTPLSKRKPWPMSGAESPSSPAPPIIICIPAGAMASASGCCRSLGRVAGILPPGRPRTGHRERCEHGSDDRRHPVTTDAGAVYQSHPDLPSDRAKPISTPVFVTTGTAGWMREPSSDRTGGIRTPWWRSGPLVTLHRLLIGGPGAGGARARLWEARHEPGPGVTEAYDLAAIIDVDGSGVGHGSSIVVKVDLLRRRP